MVDANTKSSPNKPHNVNRLFYDFNGDHPDITTYRLRVYNTLELNPNSCSIDNAFSIQHEPALDLVPPKPISYNPDVDLLQLGAWLNQSGSTRVVLGSPQLHLNRSWQALPSLSPNEVITHITCDKTIGYEVRYSPRDNLYYIRATQDQSEVVNLRFLCQIPPPPKVAVPQAIQDLIKDIKGYAEAELGLPTPKATGKQYLDALKTQRKGSCRHRAIVFKAIMDEKYPQYPTRIISNNCHMYTEVQIGEQWLRCDLEGYPSRLQVHDTLSTEQIKTLSSPKTSTRNKEAEELALLTKKYKSLLTPSQAPSMSRNAWLQSLLQNRYTKQLIHCQDINSQQATLLALYEKALAKQQPVFLVESVNDLHCAADWIENRQGQGVIHRGPGGKLYDFLMQHRQSKKQPLLLINYAGFKPEDIVRFNSLLDNTRQADGTPVPQAVKIIGVQDVNEPKAYLGSDFISRFDQVDAPTPAVVKELTTPRKTQEQRTSTQKNYVIHLFDANDWRQRLLGRWVFDGQKLTWVGGGIGQSRSIRPKNYCL